MNIEKYKNDGWGLCQNGFKDLHEIIKNHEKPHLSVLEFGSGTSTQFFVDIVENKVKNLTIESYDNDPNWCYKDSEKHNFLNLKMRDLIECDDQSFASMFVSKEYNRDVMNIQTAKPHTRQKNCFYDIKESDLCREYDIVVIDGPNGNGRSFAFLHLKDVLKDGAFVFIDDYTHYPFVNTLKHFFNVELYSESNVSNSQQYAIYKIKKTSELK